MRSTNRASPAIRLTGKPAIAARRRKSTCAILPSRRHPGACFSGACVQSASELWFDEAYYQRYYFDKKTRVVDPAHAERLGAFVCSYLHYLRVPVARVLDRRLKDKISGKTDDNSLDKLYNDSEDVKEIKGY